MRAGGRAKRPDGTAGKWARYRSGGVAKVTGEKIYARDFRARDTGGWPALERDLKPGDA